MCGRYNVIPNAEAFVDAFGILDGIEALPKQPRYNIAPSGDPVPAVWAESGTRELALLRWPLLPHWAKEGRIKFTTANAKGETVGNKPAFRTAGRKDRGCLIPSRRGVAEKLTKGRGAKLPLDNYRKCRYRELKKRKIRMNYFLLSILIYATR